MNKKYFRRIIAFLLSVFMIASLTCCTNDVKEIPDATEIPTQSPSEEPEQTEAPAKEYVKVENGVLKLSALKGSSLNPLITNSRDLNEYLKLVFEPLFEFDGLFALKPILVKKHTKSVDFKVWEFELLSGVSFSNGILLTASDVVATYSSLLGKEGRYSENVSNIAGVFEKDTHTVQFVLYEPDASFPEKLTVPIVYEKSITQNIPIGTGLFKITKETASLITLELNTNFHDDGKKPQIKEVSISLFASEKEKYTSSFDIGFLYGANTADYILDGTKNTECFQGTTYYSVAINTTPSYRISQQVKNDVSYLTFPNPCADKNVRKALSYLISRTDILNASGAGNGKISLMPAFNGTPKRHQVYEDFETSEFYAGECLENAGYKKNEDGLWMNAEGNQLEIKILTLRTNKKLCEMMRTIRDILTENGIAVTYESVFEAEYKEKIASKNYVLVGMETELNGISDIYDFFAKDGKHNIALWENEKVSEYLEKLKTIDDDAIYNAALGEIEKIVVDECPILGFYIASYTAIIGNTLRGCNADELYAENLFADFCDWYIVEEKK